MREINTERGGEREGERERGERERELTKIKRSISSICEISTLYFVT